MNEPNCNSELESGLDVLINSLHYCPVKVD